MSHITLLEAQQWFSQDRLTVTSVDTTLEASAFDIVASTLSDTYATSTWTDDTTTPSLVRKIISMLHGAWIYNRTYSDQGVEANDGYGYRLESSAMTLLGGIKVGSVDLVGVDTTTENAVVKFWPTDVSTATAVTDPCAPNAAPMAFSMGKVF